VVGLFVKSYKPLDWMRGVNFLKKRRIYKMKSKLSKLGLICLAAILFSSLFVSCASEAETTTPAPTTITDQLGRTVTLATTKPQRIISLAPSNTEILFALGLGDRIVGVTDYCNYPPEAKEIPSIGAYDIPNIEEIVAREPDLILGTEAQSENIYQQLEDRGITVIAVYPTTMDEVLASITLIGIVTDAEKEASSLVKSIQERIKAVTDKTSKLTESEKPRVFYIFWHDPIWTSGSGSFADALIQMAGGSNIARELSGFAEISLEVVVTANPQVIIAGVGMGTGEDLSLQFVKTESRLSDSDARKNDRIYGVNMDIIGRPGPRIVDALEEFFALIHPELK
jgi:iron complex transport system substrate-binding protein